ncbi:Uncharacterised protein [Candidatus Venteria ishoeyi]|uniref:NAD(P)-binding domain-containing protein n=2 Tax=Candidatus Venteria ishoeyi TaxID=1899563 RepID=A0A1H6F4S8_9GAMM|nr:Uncharacterised protein [Candidatus Venteria ishoeyi]
MIGSLVLLNALNSKDIGKVISISREKSHVHHPKLKEVIRKNFSNFNSIKKHFKNIDLAYYCIGVYTGKVPSKLFRKITVDYLDSFAHTLKEESPKATFCLMSAGGADRSEKSKIMFTRDKGAAENILLKYKFPKTYILRPNYIYPSIKRKEPHLGYVLLRILYPLFKPFNSSWTITSAGLAKAFFKIGLKRGSKKVYENKEIRKYLEN